MIAHVVQHLRYQQTQTTGVQHWLLCSIFLWLMKKCKCGMKLNLFRTYRGLLVPHSSSSFHLCLCCLSKGIWEGRKRWKENTGKSPCTTIYPHHWGQCETQAPRLWEIVECIRMYYISRQAADVTSSTTRRLPRSSKFSFLQIWNLNYARKPSNRKVER